MAQKRIFRPALCGAIALSALGGFSVCAQETGGKLLSFGIEQRFETGRNLRLVTPAEGSGSIASTVLSFGLSSETPLDSLSLNITAPLRITDLPAQSTQVGAGDFSLALDYGREVPNARLTFGASLLREDIDFLRPLADFIGDSGMIELPDDFANLTGGGTRRAFSVTTGLELGREDLVGYVFNLGFSGVDYSGTTDPDLVRRRTQDVGAAVILRFSPLTTGRLDVAATQTRDADLEQTATLTRLATFGIDHELSSRLRLAAALGYQIEDRDELVGGVPPVVTTRNQGAFGSLGLAYDLSNGTLTGALSSTTDLAGRLTTFTLGRSLEIPDGTLALTFGVSDSQSDGAELIGSVSYRQEFGPSDILLDARRSITTSDDDESRATDTLSLGYIYNLDPRARIGLSVAYVQTAATLTATRLERMDVNANYTRALTEDWDVNIGAVYRSRTEGGVGDTASSSVFLSLERRFDLRF